VGDQEDREAGLRRDLVNQISAAQELAIHLAMSRRVSERLLAWAARFAERCARDVEKLRRL
jgi:hypothetical protein